MIRPCLIIIIICAAVGPVLMTQESTSQDSNGNTDFIPSTTTTTPAVKVQSSSSNPTTVSTTTKTTTTIISSSTSANTIAIDMSAADMKQENCSACISSFQKIYQNSNTTSMPDHSDMMINCSQDLRQTNSCFSIVRDNCSEILGLLFTFNANLSFGLTCVNSEIRVIKWTECLTTAAKMINDSNTFFCRYGNFSCSLDQNGIYGIKKIEVLEPLRKANSCSPPVSTRPTIPLLPNPVGPSAITAIVVLVCLFIVGVLAGFFFWPKCHMAEIPAEAHKKKGPPPAEAFNVAYSSPAVSPTGAANASIVVSPGQFPRGPAAA